MAPVKQLTIYGGEDEFPRPPLPRRSPIGPLSAYLLQEIERRGSLRAVEAGNLLHARRDGCPQAGARYSGWKGTRATGCCPYAATDGYSALQRLLRRQLVRKLADGSYVSTKP